LLKRSQPGKIKVQKTQSFQQWIVRVMKARS